MTLEGRMAMLDVGAGKDETVAAHHFVSGSETGAVAEEGGGEGLLVEGWGVIVLVLGWGMAG